MGGKRVGFNPSGLLWAGGYTGENQFHLKLNYKEYCKKVVTWLQNNGYTVYLIPHAISNIPSDPDDDLAAIHDIQQIFEGTVVIPPFDTPMEAKSYISNMDLFIGARMHATIAAYSSGVPVIPVSYSKKFEGLYSSLQYPYVIKGLEDTTESAVENTIRWVKNIGELRENIHDNRALVQERVHVFSGYIEQEILRDVHR